LLKKPDEIQLYKKRILQLTTENNEKDERMLSIQRNCDFLENNIKSLQLIEKEYNLMKKQLRESENKLEDEKTNLSVQHKQFVIQLEKQYKDENDSTKVKLRQVQKELDDAKSALESAKYTSDKQSKEYDVKLKDANDRCKNFELDRNKLQSEVDKLKLDIKQLNYR